MSPKKVMLLCLLDPEADPSDFEGVGTMTPDPRSAVERCRADMRGNTHGIPPEELYGEAVVRAAREVTP